VDKGKDTLMIISVVIVIVLLTGLSYYYLQQSDEAEGITALEGKEIADVIAFEWDKDAMLMAIIPSDDIDENGNGLRWNYYYLNSLVPGNVSELTVLVAYNDTVISDARNISYSLDEEFPIDGDFLDSNQAAEIVYGTDTYIEWEQVHKASKVMFLVLHNDSVRNVWLITVDGGNDYNYYWPIRINATTGEEINYRYDIQL